MWKAGDLVFVRRKGGAGAAATVWPASVKSTRDGRVAVKYFCSNDVVELDASAILESFASGKLRYAKGQSAAFQDAMKAATNAASGVRSLLPRTSHPSAGFAASARMPSITDGGALVAEPSQSRFFGDSAVLSPPRTKLVPSGTSSPYFSKSTGAATTAHFPDSLAIGTRAAATGNTTIEAARTSLARKRARLDAEYNPPTDKVGSTAAVNINCNDESLAQLLCIANQTASAGLNGECARLSDESTPTDAANGAVDSVAANDPLAGWRKRKRAKFAADIQAAPEPSPLPSSTSANVFPLMPAAAPLAIRTEDVLRDALHWREHLESAMYSPSSTTTTTPPGTTIDAVASGANAFDELPPGAPSDDMRLSNGQQTAILPNTTVATTPAMHKWRAPHLSRFLTGAVPYLHSDSNDCVSGTIAGTLCTSRELVADMNTAPWFVDDEDGTAARCPVDVSIDTNTAPLFGWVENPAASSSSSTPGDTPAVVSSASPPAAKKKAVTKARAPRTAKAAPAPADTALPLVSKKRKH